MIKELWGASAPYDSIMQESIISDVESSYNQIINLLPSACESDIILEDGNVVYLKPELHKMFIALSILRITYPPGVGYFIGACISRCIDSIRNKKGAKLFNIDSPMFRLFDTIINKFYEECKE